jgi:hypothetical protein
MARGDQELNNDGGEVLPPLHFLPKQQLRCHDGSRQSAFQIARASPTRAETTRFERRTAAAVSQHFCLADLLFRFGFRLAALAVGHQRRHHPTDDLDVDSRARRL